MDDDVRDAEIEASVQHDLALWRTTRDENGYGAGTDDDDVRDRLDRIEQHLGFKRGTAA